ncbi:MAG TPA: GAF domain-containing sensor histidine kinase [Anaerolineae bacterium]|nr:GAF domain-containing sensor histidine kinase [Anaerolineae bacterium]HQI85900.1 GAF domain-containing sensor histidine kinase [Anaerolineae bacterium]
MARHRKRKSVIFENIITTISTNFINLQPDEIDAEMNRALRTISQVTRVERSCVALFSDDKRQLTCTHTWSAPEIVAQNRPLLALSPAAWPWLTARITRGEIVNVPLASALPPEADAERRMCRAQGIQSFAAIPMTYRGAVVGLLKFDAIRAQKTWSEHTIILLKTVGEIFVNALEHKRAQEALQLANQTLEQRVRARTQEIERRQRVAEGLRDILVVLNSDRPVGEILNYLVAQACSLLGSSACVLYRVSQEERRIIIEASFGLPEVFLPIKTLPLHAWSVLGHGELGGTHFDRQPFAIPDVTTSPIAAAVSDAALPADVRDWCRAAVKHYHAFLTVPLVIKEEFYGNLGFYYAGSRQFSDEDIRLGMSFGNHAALAIENARLRVQAEQAAILQERSRLARDLHDSVTQLLYSLTLLAEAGRRLAQAGDLQRVDEAMVRLGEIGQQAFKEMRLLVYELRPLALENVGLVRALQQRLDTVERRAGVDAALTVTGEVCLPAPLEEELYHITQEALNNALKHAAATSIAVRIAADEKHIAIDISDDGKGLNLDAIGGEGGIGLSSMRERAAKLGGALNIVSLPGKGTNVNVTVNLDHA